MWRYLVNDFFDYVTDSNNNDDDDDNGKGEGEEGNDADDEDEEGRNRYYADDDDEEEAGDDYEREEILEGWSAIPDIILEDILGLLTPKQRHQASMVCRRWYRYFYSPRVWERFTLTDRSFTRKKFNLYLGYQHESDPRKVQMSLARVGSFFKSIVVPPIKDYFNLYEFLRVLGYFLNYFDKYPMPHLRTFHFTFHCEFWEHGGMTVHGTGGDILDKTKKVIGSMQKMREIRLSNLMLDIKDAADFIDPVYRTSGDSLRTLALVNCTNEVFPFPMVAQMSALQKLVISSNNLDDQSVLLFAGTQLTEIQIVEDHLTPSSVPIAPATWSFLLEMIPYIRVVLRTLGRLDRDMMQQPGAPVYSVIHENPRSQLKPAVAMQIADLYHRHLELFAQLKLPRVHGSRSFSERVDSGLLMMVRSCPRLHTLIIKERLSTATLLLLVGEGKNLKKLYVRENALLRKFDWPRSPESSDSFHRWLKRTSYDMDALKDHVSGVLGYRWRPLTDKKFKLLTLS